MCIYIYNILLCDIVTYLHDIMLNCIYVILNIFYNYIYTIFCYHPNHILPPAKQPIAIALTWRRRLLLGPAVLGVDRRKQPVLSPGKTRLSDLLNVGAWYFTHDGSSRRLMRSQLAGVFVDGQCDTIHIAYIRIRHGLWRIHV